MTTASFSCVRTCVRAAMLCVALWIVSPRVEAAQTLALSSGVQTYSTLASTTVTMTGTSELFITGTSSPISGSVINLNSIDAWFFMPGIPPSVVTSTYLSQIFVNGAAATTGNVRIVEYGQGAVVIPQSPAFQPLTVYTGPYFSGSSAILSQYTAYASAATLGGMYDNIGSFKLKRGYIATFAANGDGTGSSMCYIAQEGDITVPVLPAALQNSISFVRIFPWRWVSKKGTAGVAGSGLNIAWIYDWNIDMNSTPDLEYVPIRQNANWPGLNQNWQSIGADQLLGYNEPDNTVQANMPVSAAISGWPGLLGTGLRVGAPAVTDGGQESWLYPFMATAAADNLRVDFVPIHYYQCVDPTNPAAAATQLYNFLAATYAQVKRPIWLTEFNNGANWTTCAVPTYAQQQQAVQDMITMLDSTPFVERYAIYNWVGDTRSVVLSGTLTPAGLSYAAEVSPIGYVQAVPSNGSRGVVQLPFDGTAADTSGFGNNGVTTGAPSYAAGKRGLAIQLDGATSFVQLPANVANAPAFSYAGWVYWNGGAAYQRIFDFGNDTNNFMFLAATSNAGTMRFGISVSGYQQTLDAPALPVGRWTHVAVTLSGGTVKIYTNGTLAATSSAIAIDPSEFTPAFNYLGKSQFPGDPRFSGMFDDVRIFDYALTAGQVASLMTDNPPVFTSTFITGGTPIQGNAYSGTVAGAATDPDPGDTVTYSKASGPAWLVVGSSGLLSGTPAFTDQGSEYFTICATDTSGEMAYAVYSVTLPTAFGNGTWTADASGNWSDSTKWAASSPANGSGNTANFATLNITANRTVVLDSSRTIGALQFSDTSGSQTWTLSSAGGTALTLAGASVPSIAVTRNSATISASLTGSSGFNRIGPGTLILSGNNPVTGLVNIDTGSTTTNEGIMVLASPTALENASTLQFNSENAGSSTLQLDGSLGNITVPAAINLTGRNNTVPAIENLSGTNTLGSVSLNVGGGDYIFQSDAGLLDFTSFMTLSAGTSRTFTFQGSGSFVVGGVISNGTFGGIGNVTKTGTGTLTLLASNTYTGATLLNAGTLALDGSVAAAGSITGLAGTTLSGTGSTGAPVVINGFHAPGAPLGTQTFTGTLTYGPAARLEWTLGSNSTTTGSASAVAGSTVKIGAGAVIDLVPNGPGSTVDFTSSYWLQAHAWTVLSCTSLSGSFALGNIGADPNGVAAANYGAFSLVPGANSLSVAYAPYTPFQYWQQTYFGASWNNPAIAGDTAVCTSDGLTNLVKYALGVNPTVPNPAAAPRISINGGRLTIAFTRNTAASDLTISVMGADSPSGPWTELTRSYDGGLMGVITAGATVSDLGPGAIRNVQVSDLYLINDPAHPHRFLKLQVLH